MRDDLNGLEVCNRELQKLTNLPINDELPIIINPIRRLWNKFIEHVQGPEAATTIFIALSSLLGSYIVFDVTIRLFASWVTLPSWILFLLLSITGISVTQGLLYFIWKQRKKIASKNMTYTLRSLLNDVERYNSVITAIDINDQLETAGNQEVGIKERHKVLSALRLTRDDLIRALKTEKILRENKNFIINNTDLFVNNLSALNSLQVTEQATEHGRLLNEALQIALDVQDEMRRLQQSQY